MILGELSFDFGQIDKASFYFLQYFTSTKFTGNYQKKVKALLKLVKCAFRLKLYNEAMKLLRKALQYAWKCEDTKLELKIYEDMGLAYFYQGELAKSQYYHH